MKQDRSKKKPFGPVQSQGALPQQQSVSHEDAIKVISKRNRNKKTFQPSSLQAGAKLPSPMTVASGFASNTAQGVGSIAEMARALRDDVDLIYEFVASNIEFIPTFGSQKGALGCLIDGYGNSFDQADLMVQLLREAGYTADYVFGELDLSASDAGDWLGTDTFNGWASGNYLANSGTPNTVTWTGTEYRVQLSHCWVRCDIGGTDYYFDPAMKSYTTKSGINLATAMGYNASTYLSDAKSGATVNTDYVEDMNSSNIRDNLDDYTESLIDYIQQNDDDATLTDILGGREIVPQSGQVRQTSLSYVKSGTTPTVWTSIPNSYKTTLDVEYDTIDESFYSADIHGKRLSLTFNGSLQAELRLDGTLVATSSAQGAGTWNSVLLTITHPYPTTFADQAVWHRIWADKSYIIAQAWGNCNREMFEIHNRRLQEEQSDGGSSGDEAVLGQWLQAHFHMWNTKKSFSSDIINRMTECATVLHHQCGVVGYYDSILTDLGAINWSSSALDNDYDHVKYNDDTLALHGIAFEALATQAIDHRTGGISSTPLLDIANSAGQKIYDGKTANWSSNVKPNLTNYDSSTLTDIENWYINWGWRVAIPEDADITDEDWTGFGYFALSPWQGSVGIIGGGLKGGSGNTDLPDPDEDKKKKKKDDDDDEGEDPTNIQTGAYLYSAIDLTIGSASYPYGLSFERYYNSESRFGDGALGRGWSHNLSLSAQVESDPLRGMGWDSPISGAASIVELFVCVDLFKDLTKPFDKYITAVLGNQWLVDTLTKNVVVVSFTEGNQFFVKQPDGSYLTPTDTASTLVQNGDDTYTFTTPQGAEYNYKP